jgi:exopolysaccharide biosynthesis WecB/TagA/CpsF family protein
MSYRRNPESAFQMLEVPVVRTERVIGDVRFEVADRRTAAARIYAAITNNGNRVFAFCNMHTFNLAKRVDPLAKALSKATVFNDGLGIDAASLILYGEKFPDNLNGTDLTPLLLSSFERPVSVYLVGSPPGVADEAAKVLEKNHRFVRIVGCHHGFFEKADADRIVGDIRAAGTELLLLGMGNPRQELWATEIVGRTDAVILCVGAFFDFTAGRISRAPLMVRKLRCEWLYRIAVEPSRLWRRYIGGAVPFLYAVLLERLRRPRVAR